MTPQEPCRIEDLCESVGLAGLAFEMELEEHAPHCSILFCRTPSGPCHEDVRCRYSEPRGSDDAMHETFGLYSQASPDTTCPSGQMEQLETEQSLSGRCTESTRCPVASKLSVVARSPSIILQASSSDSDAEGDAEYVHARLWARR
jgi:hypothetical protein